MIQRSLTPMDKPRHPRVLRRLAGTQRLIAILTAGSATRALRRPLRHARPARPPLLARGYPGCGGFQALMAESIMPVIERTERAPSSSTPRSAQVAVKKAAPSACGSSLTSAYRAADRHQRRQVLNPFGALPCHDVAEPRTTTNLTLAALAHLCLYLGSRSPPSAGDLQARPLDLSRLGSGQDHLQRRRGSSGPAAHGVRVVPSSKDPTSTPPSGRATMNIIAAAPYAWFERMRKRPEQVEARGAEYDAFKGRLASRMIEALEQLCQLPARSRSSSSRRR